MANDERGVAPECHPYKSANDEKGVATECHSRILLDGAMTNEGWAKISTPRWWANDERKGWPQSRPPLSLTVTKGGHPVPPN